MQPLSKQRAAGSFCPVACATISHSEGWGDADNWWIIGQWQRPGYFPSFFWEDVGRHRGAIWQLREMERRKLEARNRVEL